MAEKQKQLEWTGRKMITSENKTKGIEKKYNDKTGKYETIAIEIPKITTAQQIEKTKAEINQSHEISKKLLQQHETLREQVQNLRTLVTEKAQQFKKEQEERDRKLMRMIKSNNLDIAIAQMSEDKVAERLRELENELKSAQKSGEILANERDKAKQQNESKDITKEIESLTAKLEDKKKELKNQQKTNQLIQRQNANNQKKLEQAEKGATEAAEINQLNKELCMLREKENKIQDKKNKLEKDLQIIEGNITEYQQKIDSAEGDQIQQLRDKCEKILKAWEAKKEQLELEQNESNLKLVRDKKKEKEKEKEKDKDKDKDDDVQKSVKSKRVADYIKEKKDYSKLKVDEQNFVSLFTVKKDLERQIKKKLKKVEQEREQIESSINNLKLEKQNLLNAIKEREREKELAETKGVEENEKLAIAKQRKLEELEKKEKEKLEKYKSEQRMQLSPLKPKTGKEAITKETLRKEKDEQLKQFKEKYQKLPKEKVQQYLQEPFKLSFQELEEKKKKKQQKEDEKDDKDKIDVKSLSIIEAVCRTKHRGTKRDWFGYEPNEQTVQCDDVHVLGQFSIKHRIRKIIVHHNPNEGLIYLFSTEYKREDDTLINGVWNINQEFLEKNKDIQRDELDLSDNDRIKSVVLRRDNSFVSFIQFTTKNGKQFKVGKEVIEKTDDDKPKEKSDDQQEKKDQEGGEKKEENPDKRVMKVDDWSMLITFFGGYTLRNEKEFAMSYFGYEMGKKLTPEEYEQYLLEKKERMEKKIKQDKLKQLQESLASDLNKSTIVRKK